MKAFVLAGGSGTRLWPLSRKSYPKQFMKIEGGKSFLQQTIERLLPVIPPEDIIVITNDDYKFHVMSSLNSLPLPTPRPEFNIILEPVGRNTAPAIALGVKYCMEQLGCDEKEVVFICPSDHIIRPPEMFAGQIAIAENLAKEGYIVTFGVKPDRPETGYGYIKAAIQKAEACSRNPTGLKVEEFIEKPDLETAKQYVNGGNYFWNSGMFAFAIDTIMDEFERHKPEIRGHLNLSFDELLKDFHRMPDISIDYAVAEKSDRVVTLPIDLYWNDIGSWDSLSDLMEKDVDGNIKKGDVLTLDTNNTFILGNNRLIAAIGIDNCLIVDTDDALLIAKKGQAHKVKDLVQSLKEKKCTTVEEHVTTYRPWGSYTILEQGGRYKIKRIVVNPAARLSLQMHHHRSEHWVVVKGTAKVTIADKELFIHENESAYVPKSTIHRLENPGKLPLEIIEVQNGEYVGEDDIVRMDDIYGRKA